MIKKVREYYTKAKDYATHLAVRTQAEIAVGAIIGALALGSAIHANEEKRSLFQPISFSEYEELEDKAKNEGRELNNLTWFYAGVNDYTAKIAEAHNWNSIWGIIPQFHRFWFQRKLEQAMDTTGRIYRRNIRDFAKIIPKHANGALKDLEDLISASARSTDLRQILEGTWSYSHTETGHWYPVSTQSCTTDANGQQSCTTTTTMHYQCDFWHHKWEYDPISGKVLSEKLNQAKTIPEIKHIKIETPIRTNAWNEQVIRQSFRHMKKREPTEAEILETAQFFKTGSQYELNLPLARITWNQIINKDSKTWEKYLPTAKTTTETTGCYPTDGPEEYEFAKELGERLDSLVQHEQNITTGIRKAIIEVPSLEKKIKTFIIKQEPPLRHRYPEIRNEDIKKSPSPSTLSRQIIRGARDLYSSNIPKGNINTDYRGWLLALGVFLGGMLGGLAGLGADALVDRYVAPTFRRKYY